MILPGSRWSFIDAIPMRARHSAARAAVRRLPLAVRLRCPRRLQRLVSRANPTPDNERGVHLPVDSTRICLGDGERIEEVTPARELAITHSPQVEEVGLAGLAGRLDAQSDVPGDDHFLTLSDELLKVH